MKFLQGMKLKFPKVTMFDEDSENGIPRGNITYVIAFFIPLVMFIALYYVREIFPFGDEAYLRSDMYHQYAPFFSEFWDKLRNGESLTYSWDIGMGTNFTALYAYYLASPANWLIALFPQKFMIEIMNSLIILKLAASSLTFAVYISKHFKTKTCTIALFGMFYAMSGFVAAYSWNIMWLDCILLLPLIMLGLERLVNENKCLLYSISLGLCIFTNYYISIMICMSVVLYYIVLMCAYKGNRCFKIYLKKFLQFGLYSLIAGGIAACLLLPEMYALSLSASSDVVFPANLTSYFPMMEMLVRQLINVPIHLGLEHFPNIYCGVAIFLLIPLYLMNKKISSTEKVGKIAILLVFLLAYNLNIPNFIWHGFHFPNSLPARQSFIYIFFILIMCYDAFKDIKQYSKKQIGGAVWCSVVFLILAEQLYAGDKYNFKIFYISGAFILFYGFLMYLYKKNALKVPALLFLLFASTIIECTMNMESTGLSTTSRSSYLLDYNAVSDMVDNVEANDKSFYRMEKVNGIRSKNDSAWHNYKSISTFSSTANAGITELLGMLGCQHSTNAYAFKGATAFTSSMFSVKYLISNTLLNESNLLSYYGGTNGEFVYRYNYTLPVGFMVNKDIENLWDTDSIRDGIEIQNSFIEANTGISNVFVKNYEYRTESNVNIIPVKDGHMYLIAKNQGVESIGVSINGTVTNFNDLKSNNSILDIGYVTTSDQIDVYSDTNMNLLVYTLDTDKYIQAFNLLSSGGLNVTSHSNTKIKGNVDAVNGGIMFFSIPFDEGWTVKVDGKQVKTFDIKDGVLGIELSAGYHDVSLSYLPVGLIPGFILTAISILILVLLTMFRRRQRRGQINMSKLPLSLQEILNEEDIIIERPTPTIKTVSEINENMEYTVILEDDEIAATKEQDTDSTITRSE